jgi:hypothetical protein
MAEGQTDQRVASGAGEPAADGFAVIFLVDEAGAFLCAAGPSFRPAAAGAVPANARHAAAHFAIDGTLPPRSARRLALREGELVAVAGDACVLGVLLSRPAAPADESRAMAAVLAFEASNAHHLSAAEPRDETWANGAAATLKAAWSAPFVTLPGRPPATDVYAHAVAVPRGASLTLQLSLRNESALPARRVKVRFASPRSFLRPAAVYGEGAILGGATLRLLEPLEPGVREFAVHFIPVEARRGPLAVTMTYTTARGQVVSVPARRVSVHIDAPPLAAPVEANPEALKSFLRRRELARDGWRIYVRPHVTAQFAFERAKEAIERDRPLKVLEFASVHPAHFEAWYLAHVKGAGRPVFVEISVHARSRILEIRAATELGEDLIGAVAEYRRRLHELLSDRFMRSSGRVVLIDAAPLSQKDAPPELHAALLLRHMEGEISAQELEDELRRAVLREGDDALGLLEAYDGNHPPDHLPGAKDGTPGGAHGGGRSFEFEFLPGLLESWRPIVMAFASDESLDAPGPVTRRRREYDRSSDHEIQDFEGEDWS